MTFSEFGGGDHTRRIERFNGVNMTFVIRAGAPSVVYNGVQSLKYIIVDAIRVFL